MFVAVFNDVVHFSGPDTCIYKSRTKKIDAIGASAVIAPKNLSPNPFPKGKGNQIEETLAGREGEQDKSSLSPLWEGGRFNFCRFHFQLGERINFFLVPLSAREGVRG
jgi:hypothetical protein